MAILVAYTLRGKKTSSEYSGAAEPLVRKSESHHSGLAEPPLNVNVL